MGARGPTTWEPRTGYNVIQSAQWLSIDTHTLLIKLDDKAPLNYTPAIKLLWLHIPASLITADF